MNQRPVWPVSRRKFLGQLGTGTAAAFGLAALSLPTLQNVVEAATVNPLTDNRRRAKCFRTRRQAAEFEHHLTTVAHPSNGEEDLYANKIANFSKGLPHNSLGEVDLAAYNLFIAALTSGNPADFEAIPLGLGRKLTNPQSGL